VNRILRALILATLFSIGITTISAQANSQTFTGSISNSRISEYYPISLNAGEAVLITAEATSGTLDTYLILRDPNGAIVAENDDRETGVITDSALGAIADISGDYEVEVTRYPEGDSTGAYDLTIEIGTPDILNQLTELIVRVTLSGPEQTIDTANFRIHYTTSGADAVDAEFLNAVVQAAEEFYDIQINQLGWAAPPRDGFLGGDDRYDIYIQDLIGSGEGALGYASPDTVVGDNPNTPETELNAASSYLVLDNDYNDSDAVDLIGLMRTTFTHEFNHVVQFGYDGDEPQGWVFEATASWIETVSAGKDEDATGYVEYNYQYPELCFGTTTVDPDGGMLQYGDWMFIQMLADVYGRDSVVAYWRHIAQKDNWASLESFLSERGSTIPDALAAYRLKNLARDYRLAPEFNATVWLENTIDDLGSWTFTGQGIQSLGANYFRFDLPPGAYNAEISGDRGGLQLWAVGILGDEKVEAIPLGRGASFDTTPYSEAYLMVFDPAYSDDVENCTYQDYNIQVQAGKGFPVLPYLIFPATYFQTLG
jgi:hypothetical protein